MFGSGMFGSDKKRPEASGAYAPVCRKCLDLGSYHILQLSCAALNSGNAYAEGTPIRECHKTVRGTLLAFRWGRV